MLIDTNVLVSAVLFGGLPARLLEAASAGRLEAVVSLHILGEFRDVLMRSRFGLSETVADALAEEIAEFSEVVAVERASDCWTADPGDDPVVEAALRGGVGFVVTGDVHLLVVEVLGLRFLTPRDLLVMLEEQA